MALDRFLQLAHEPAEALRLAGRLNLLNSFEQGIGWRATLSN
jgi:hypothetical protein